MFIHKKKQYFDVEILNKNTSIENNTESDITIIDEINIINPIIIGINSPQLIHTFISGRTGAGRTIASIKLFAEMANKDNILNK